MQEKEQEITALFWVWLCHEESIEYTPSGETPHPISTHPPKETNGTSHSLLHNISAENDTPVMLCACLAEKQLLAFVNAIFFSVTTQNYRSLYKIMRESLSSPSVPLHTVAAAGNGADKMLMSHHPDLHLYLWSCHDGCRGCNVQPPLPKVHEGIVAPVFCLDEAVIDLLSEQKTKQTIGKRTRKASSGLCSQPQTLGRVRSPFVEVDVLHFRHCGWKEVHSQYLQRWKVCWGAVTSIAGFGNSLIYKWKIGTQNVGCWKQEKSAWATWTNSHLQTMHSKDKWDCLIVKNNLILWQWAAEAALPCVQDRWPQKYLGYLCTSWQCPASDAHGTGRRRVSGFWCCSVYSDTVKEVPALILPPSGHWGLDDNDSNNF